SAPTTGSSATTTSRSGRPRSLPPLRWSTGVSAHGALRRKRSHASTRRHTVTPPSMSWSTTCRSSSTPSPWHSTVAISACTPSCAVDELSEGKALLQWLADEHFTFLGYREYELTADDRLLPVPGTGLGLLRDAPEDPSLSFSRLPPDVRAKAREKTLLVLTKANARSTVHRKTHLDYVGIKRYDAGGEVVGEHRFIGL